MFLWRISLAVCLVLSIGAGTSLAQGVITTVAGSATQGFSGDGGPATSARLNFPKRIALAADGSLYFTDAHNNRIRKVGADGRISTVAGNGDEDFGGDGGPATSAKLSVPYSVAVAPDGTLYIADTHNHRIRRVGTDGRISTIAGNDESDAGDGGPATLATLYYPRGVALAADGSLYIADSENHKIRKVSTDGRISTVAGNGTDGFAGDGGAATSAQLNYPYDVAVGPDGSIYIADSENYRIRRVGADGRISTIAGSGTEGFGGDGGVATSARLDSPIGVAVAADGTVYIADYDNHRIRRVGTDGRISTVAGTGVPGYNGDGRSATSAQIYYPFGVAVAANGTLYIADAVNDRIRRVVFTAPVETSISVVSGNNQTANPGASFGQPLVVKVANASGSPLAGVEVRFSVASGSGTLSASSATTDASGLAQVNAQAGSSAGALSVSATTGTASVTFTLTITTPVVPPLSASIPQINFSAVTGASAPAPQLVAITSAGSTLAVTVSSTSPWLLANPVTGTTPLNLTVSVNHAGLQAGAYTGSIRITASGGSSLTIPVTLTVLPPSNIPVTVTSAPPGLNVIVDGTAVTTPRVFNWTPGSSHTLDVQSPQTRGATRSVFERWSNAGPKSQTITAPAAATTYTVFFTNEYQLTAITNPANGGTLTASPTSSDGFYAAGTQVRLTATAAANFTFANFSGDLAGSTNPQNIGLSEPRSVTANFTAAVATTKVTISSNPTGRSIVVDGASITAPRDFDWTPGSVHILDATSPQGSSSLSRFAFSHWSQGGERAQSVITPITATTYTATFANQHLLTISVVPSEGGSVTATPASADGFYDEGAQVRLTATPASGFSFSGFFRDLSGTANPQIISMGSFKSVRADFAALPQITVTPLQVDITAAQGTNATAELRVTGTSAQPVAVTVDQPWLRVNPSQGAPPFTISVAAVSTGLLPNLYTGTIGVGGVQSIPVNFRVTAPVESPRLVPDAPPTGLRFEVLVGAPAPKRQSILVNSSNGAATSFTVNTIIPAGTPNWVDLSSRAGQTPASISAGVRVTSLTGPGTYTAQLQFQANGAPDVLVPIALEYKAAQTSRIEIDLQELKLTSSGEMRRQSLIVRNSGTGVQPFTVEVLTDDGRNWLTVSPMGGSAVIDQPAVLQIGAEARGLPQNTYTGRVRIQAAGQAAIIVPVIFAVNSLKTLRAADSALNWRVNRNYTDFPPQTLEMVAAGGTVNWQARASVGWLEVTPASGQIPAGTTGRLQVNLKLNQLQDGSNKALILVDSDGANGQVPVQVEVQMFPGSQPVLRVEPAGMAFVAPAFQNRDLVFTASTSGRISMSSTKPAWLRAEEVTGGLVQTNVHLLRVSILREGLPPDEEENRGVITLQDPSGGFVTVSVLVYVPVGSLSNATSAKAGCVPAKLIPLFTSLLPNFEQSGGAATSTEVVMIDDCGNAVASGVTGGVLDNKDPQLDLRAVGDGRYKATWSPSGSNSLVRLSVLGGDPDNGVGASVPVQTYTTIVGAATGPVLSKDRPFETEAGVRLPVLAPGTRFRMLGQNFAAADGSRPIVSLGGRQLSIVDASASQIVAVTPEDLPSNVEMQLVIQAGEALSIPEPVIVAPSWPAVAAPSGAGNILMLTGLTEESAAKLSVEGFEVRSLERVGLGLWRVTLRQMVAAGSLFTTRNGALVAPY